MNYKLQLVVGDGADFFLEDWEAGGVVMSEEVVGLFDVPAREEEVRAFKDRLSEYGLSPFSFGFMDMMRVGLADEWRWGGVRWIRAQESQTAQRAGDRVASLLAADYRRDPETRKKLLQLMQATVRKLGTPTLLDGEIPRPGGRNDRVLVYSQGIIAYNHTPHPRPFLERIARVVGVSADASGSPAAGSRVQAP